MLAGSGGFYCSPVTGVTLAFPATPDAASTVGLTGPAGELYYAARWLVTKSSLATISVLLRFDPSLPV
jgi:hypothetical protein